jgi:hypothetical protein
LSFTHSLEVTLTTMITKTINLIQMIKFIQKIEQKWDLTQNLMTKNILSNFTWTKLINVLKKLKLKNIVKFRK